MILKAVGCIIFSTFEFLERQNKLASGMDGQHLINASHWDIEGKNIQAVLMKPFMILYLFKDMFYLTASMETHQQPLV